MTDNTRETRAQHDAMQRADYRGASVAVSAHGVGVAATATILLLRSVPGRSDREEVRVWEVRYAHHALRPSWGIATHEPDTKDRRGHVHGGLPSFDAAMGVALADAVTDLMVILGEVDRTGAEAGGS